MHIPETHNLEEEKLDLAWPDLGGLHFSVMVSGDSVHGKLAPRQAHHVGRLDRGVLLTSCWSRSRTVDTHQ